MGMVAGTDWEGCVTKSDDPNTIHSFWTNWNPDRKFPIDMAGFALNLDLILKHPNATFNDRDSGEQEGIILEGVGFKSAYELEPKASGCRKVSEVDSS